MKLLIIEDEEILRLKYKEYLSEVFKEIILVDSLKEAYANFDEADFNVLLVDYNLPDGHGLDLIKSFINKNDTTIFVMITAYSKEKIAIESLNLGVYKYLEKPISKSHLIESLKDALNESLRRGEIKNLTQKFILKSHTRDRLINEYHISNREIEVLETVIIHKENKIVAEKLFISQGTVKNHLSSIFQKLFINSKKELNHLIEKFNKSSS